MLKDLFIKAKKMGLKEEYKCRLLQISPPPPKGGPSGLEYVIRDMYYVEMVSRRVDISRCNDIITHSSLKLSQ